MDETLPRSTPDNAEHALSFPSVLEIAAEVDDERPAKLPRVASERPLPASDRPTILRSVVKGNIHRVHSLEFGLACYSAHARFRTSMWNNVNNAKRGILQR